MEDLALEDLADALVLQRLEDLAARGWLDPGDGPLLRSMRARRAAGKGKSSGQGQGQGHGDAAASSGKGKGSGQGQEQRAGSSRGFVEDLLRDQEVALRVRRRAIARRPAGQGQGKGNEQAAVAAAASGSTGTGAAKEPVLFGRFWAPDVEEVPLPRNLRRERTEVSEGGWDPSALQRWHDKRQKVESSAVAGKESPAVADNGRTPGLQISGCMFLMEMREKEDEEVSSQATTLQFGSPAKSRYVSPGYPDCENCDCDLCEDPPETEVEHVKEDERNTAPYGTALYLQNKVERSQRRQARQGQGPQWRPCRSKEGS